MQCTRIMPDAAYHPTIAITARYAVACPYCGLEQGHLFLAVGLDEILCCDDDAGGCGGQFLARAEALVSIPTREIVGEREMLDILGSTRGAGA